MNPNTCNHQEVAAIGGWCSCGTLVKFVDTAPAETGPERYIEAAKAANAEWEKSYMPSNKPAETKAGPTECMEGWCACEANPCPRHVEFWQRYNNQTPQPPEPAAPVSPEPPLEWKCQCGYERNSANAIRCLRCEIYRDQLKEVMPNEPSKTTRTPDGTGGPTER